jgi:hypothetical protein
MSPSDVGGLVGSVGLLLLVPWLIAMMVVSFAFPFMCFSVVRSLRNISRQLERMNPPEPSRGGLFPNATVRQPTPDPAPSLGHQFLR